MKLTSYLSAALVIATASFAACQDDYENVDNRVYDTEAAQPSTVLIDGMADESVVSFHVEMGFPIDRETEVTYAPDWSLVDAYNAIYKSNAIALPSENYELIQPKATFIAGALTSTNVEIKIKDLNSLDRETVYVLPITVVDSPVPVLPSQKTRYIVVRGAALINVVANINENYCSLLSPTSATGLSGINELTVQCMVKIDEFGKLISTIMGIEGNFLLRIGDAGVADNQLQLATNRGNVTDNSWQFVTGKWIMVAFTFNSSTGEATLWLDGAKKATMVSSYRSAVNWGTSGFYIGKSYDDNRWLDGCIAEARVWNRILPDADLANTMHYYSVPVDSEGLVSYWKFNEGAGTLIHDYASGYDMTCNTTPTWVEVSLPE